MGNIKELFQMYHSYEPDGQTTLRFRSYVKNPYRYNAERVDYIPGIADFQYLRARYYTPDTARFIQQDTVWGKIDVPLSQNLYAYCGNNPVNFVDPSGHMAENIKDKIDALEKSLARAKNVGAGLSVYTEIETQKKLIKKNPIKSVNKYVSDKIERANQVSVDIDCSINNKREELFLVLEAQVKKDLGLIEQYKNVGYYSTQDALNIIFEYDCLITNLGDKYNMSKAIIQAILFRELRFKDARDDIADSLVTQSYVYDSALEDYNQLPWWKQFFIGIPEYPIRYAKDSSTGLGQIFSKTAVNSINHAVDNKLVDWEKYDFEDRHEQYGLWEKLKDDNEFNIEVVALVLIWSANEVGLDNDYQSYSENEIKDMFTRYNGTNDAAKEYGRETYGWYQIFNEHNK